MELYLLRHGIAEDVAADGTGDAGRRLTPVGITKMRQAAYGMQALGIELDLLISSPLVRARQTAELVHEVLGLPVQIDSALAPGCTSDALLGLLRAHPGAERVMVVGHEPDQSDLVLALTGARIQMKKGGLARIALDGPVRGRGLLIWLLTPSVLRAAAPAQL